MDKKFNEINVSEIEFSPFKLIGKDWCLVGAGNENAFNMMTASWGGVGVLWNKNVATIYIRPQRYTKKFIDSCDYFTLSFFSEEYKNALKLCGTVSGKDVDKAKETGLTPVFKDGSVMFEQAKLTLVCKKLYVQQMTPESFLDKSALENFYQQNDFHWVYVGEILKAYEK